MLELTARYPLFSQADKANWMLAGIYRKHELNENAAEFYARIIRDYPLSPLAPDAKKQLQQLGYPVPQPDPGALARMQEEQQYDRAHPEKVSLWRRPLELPLSILHSGPNVSHAAHVGEPDLQPESAEVSATEVLKTAPGTGMAAGTGAGTGGGGASTNAVSVERVGQPGTPAPPAPAADTAAGPAGTAGSNAAAAGANANANSNASASPDSSKEGGNGSDTKKKGRKDSSSKKKKGWHKIIPW